MVIRFSFQFLVVEVFHHIELSSGKCHALLLGLAGAVGECGGGVV